MGAIMRSTDWSKTGLGPVEAWPNSLKTMLGVVLGSRFPMLLWWGPDLLHLYNDAYRPILRDKHPASLAAPAATIWAEVWDVAGPMARSVMEGGPATWTEDLQLFINAGRMSEETYFTFSYSPVPGDDGRVGGILNTVQETTAKVQGERQIRMLHDLAARAAKASSEAEARLIAMEVLAANELDMPFVLLYLLDEAGGSARLAGESGWTDYAGPAKPAHAALSEKGNAAGWPFAAAVQSGQEVVVDDLAGLFGPLPPGRWNARPERAIVLPMFRPGERKPYAFLVSGISPHRAFEERYRRFFHATADQVMTVIAGARAYETEKKRAEALVEADRAKTTFFNNVSHEFRTPLTLILGPVEDALARPSPSLEGDDLRAVQRSAVRLLRLVNSLLDFARIEADRFHPRPVPIDLGIMTADLASTFRSLATRAGLKLMVDCEPLDQPVFVDPAHWERIVLNLVSNAFKFTLTGKIVVSLRARGEQVELAVEDTGCGIPAAELPRLFERFHRVEGAAGRSFEGTGIGLSLVKELVTLQGGTVSVSSVEKKGSVFRVAIPKRSAPPPAERAAHERARASPETAAAPYLLEAGRWIGAGPASPEEAPASAPAAARARVLVVDDNADMRGYLIRLLSPRWRIDAAIDGIDALASARANRPDLVLSDVMMPRMDGLELLRALRADPSTKDIPVVLLSARAGEEPIVAGLRTGADDYLVKPFSARELLARVQTHLNLARLRREWTLELERANKDLEAFGYTVSHDLNAPLRKIEAFSGILLAKHGRRMNAEGRDYLERMQTAARKLSQLVDDLLNLAKVSRAPLQRAPVDATGLARKILSDLQNGQSARKVRTRVEDGLAANADPHLLPVVFENLLANAWKYTSKRPQARIEVGRERKGGEDIFFVRDNGAGFDMAQAHRLFSPFQRLHTAAEFAGTGIGLATVSRIVSRHGGRVWADGAVDKGATVYFTLGDGAV